MKNHPITPEIIELLRNEIETCSCNELARRLGLDTSALSRYMSGKIKSFNNSAWERICAYFPQLQTEAPNELHLKMKNYGCSLKIDSTEIENFRRKLLDAIMTSDKFPPDVKIEVYNIISSIYAKK